MQSFFQAHLFVYSLYAAIVPLGRLVVVDAYEEHVAGVLRHLFGIVLPADLRVDLQNNRPLKLLLHVLNLRILASLR